MSQTVPPRYMVYVPGKHPAYLDLLVNALELADGVDGARVYEPLAMSAAERVHAERPAGYDDHAHGPLPPQEKHTHDHDHAPTFVDGPGVSITEVWYGYTYRYSAPTVSDLLALMTSLRVDRELRRQREAQATAPTTAPDKRDTP